MTHHILKTDPQWFDRIANLTKTSEVRKHDRDYHIGDRVTFIREDYETPFLRADTRQAISATISHILPASVFPQGLQPGYSVLSLTDVGDLRTVHEGQQIA